MTITIRKIYCVDVQPSTNKRNKEKQNPSLLTMLDNTATFAEKVELVRSKNPYFYLLTPKPKKEKSNE
jgi:hypothetical protein